MVHHFAAFIDMCILAAPKQNRNLDLVIVIKKPDRFLDFEADIVLTGFRSNTDFLKLGLVRLVFGLTLFLVVVEFAKIHDSANRRLGVARDFNQVKTCGLGFV